MNTRLNDRLKLLAISILIFAAICFGIFQCGKYFSRYAEEKAAELQRKKLDEARKHSTKEQQ
jgi:hypothetical protein